VDRPDHLGKPVSEAGAAVTEPEAPAPRRYDLFLRHRKGLYWRLRDEGIVPGAEKLSFPIDGHMGFRPYSDIVSVNLSSAHIPRSGAIAQCVITFRYGTTLTVSTVNAAGMPDPSRHETYYAFVADFHRRLIDAGAARRITFTTGATAGRAMMLNIALVAGGLFFVVLPLFLSLVARSWQPLEICLVGLLFLWPTWEVAQKNQPGTYSPAHPPDLLG
jgi:hypothetical protein